MTYDEAYRCTTPRVRQVLAWSRRQMQSADVRR